MNSSIRTLDLSFNRLESLPASLRDLTRLERLNLRSNRIESIPLFRCVVALQSFDLSDNALSEWPLALDATLLRSCRALMLAKNQIRLVASLMIGELKQLEYISLYGNPLIKYAATNVIAFNANALLASMRALHKRSDNTAVRPVRVLLLGKENVGKTL